MTTSISTRDVARVAAAVLVSLAAVAGGATSASAAPRQELSSLDFGCNWYQKEYDKAKKRGDTAAAKRYKDQAAAIGCGDISKKKPKPKADIGGAPTFSGLETDVPRPGATTTPEAQVRTSGSTAPSAPVRR